ncbi:amidohydrolase family protein [Thermospira aquatica]|uniref:Amidohydrolase family protein n=1 Tax=Thermospira aquatica TaxID=2828656 RepID=A0AAX3BAP9_9SPIR|nr:amidohydrolase family protein [Thermospira aquatica]URA09352.1 amidohydrolase family protein [Thermospira aquatica]
MIIDFHTHFYPEKIAPKAMEAMRNASGWKLYGDGTYQSLVQFMEEDGVSLSVNLPVATKPEQVISINRQMVEWNKKQTKVVCFGTYHPDFVRLGNPEEEIAFLASQGIRGIKLHPEYQDFYPDDPRMTEFYELCAKYHLLLLMHAGSDVAFSTTHGTPKRFREVLKVRGIRLILAHMGGYRQWEEVAQELVGASSLYLDTSFSLDLPNTLFKEIILAHEPYKVLFGSDFPWTRAGEMAAKIRSLDLGKTNEELIFSKNALWLLDI